jgi:hypothetical protein
VQKGDPIVWPIAAVVAGIGLCALIYAPRWYQKRQMKAGILREDGTYVHDPDGHPTDEFHTIPTATALADGESPSRPADEPLRPADEPVR